MAGQHSTLKNGNYYIRKSGGFFLGLDSANYVIQCAHPSQTAKWYFSKNEDGTYHIKNVFNGLSLGIEGSSTHDLSNIQTQIGSSTNNAQRWYLYDTGNGTVKIVNKKSGKTFNNNGVDAGEANANILQWHSLSAADYDLLDANPVDKSEDIVTILQFDNSGRTISSSAKTLGGTDIGATVTQYTPAKPNATGSDIKKLNRVIASAGFGRTVQNLAVNGSAERDGGWTRADWKSADPVTFTFARATDQKYNGASSFKISASEGCPAESGGCAYQDYPSTMLTPGNTYTVSAYVKTQDVVKSKKLSGGACIVLYTVGGTGTSALSYSEYLTGTTDIQINDGWRRLTATLTLPVSNYTGTRAALLLRNATGTVWYDNIQVEEGEAASDYNYLENGSFEIGSGTSPSQWTGYNMASGDGVTSGDKRDGESAYRMMGNPLTNKYLLQSVPVSGNKKDTYIVSGWAKAVSVATNDTKKFNVQIKVRYSDGYEKEKGIAAFNDSVKDWQYTCLPFNLDDGTTYRTPVSICVIPKYEYNCNTAYFDNFQLIKDAVPTYDYNDKGELYNIVDHAQKQSTLEYNGANDLIKAIDAKGYAFNYTYDSKHNVTQAKSQNNVTYDFSRDSKGVITSLEIQSDNASMKSKADLTLNTGAHAGAYVTSMKDQHNKQIDFSHDVTTGLLSSTTGPDGVVTTHIYDADNDRLMSTTRNDITNNYSYNTKNQLTALSHNGFDYNFSYDGYGNSLQAKVGSTVFLTNEYLSNNGALNKQTYGNGDTVSSDFDSFGRISKQRFNDLVYYEWLYNASGQATVHRDLYNKLQYETTNDTQGRFVRSSVVDTSQPNGSERTVFSTEAGYDVMNNVNRLTYSAGGRSVTSTYTYEKDNMPETHYMTARGRKQAYIYNGLNQLTEYTISTDVPVNIAYTHKLSERNDVGQTLYSTARIATETIGDTSYSYNYDDMGRIIEIIQDDVIKISYEYDTLDQLVRENNLYLNKTVVYNYDNGGNLTSREEYPYTVNPGLTTPAKTYSYSYGDTNWADKMTGFNGQTITYDTIGNPLLYRGYELAWAGQQLTSLSGNGTKADYFYGADGLRVRKTVNGIKSDFHYVNGKLMHEKRGELNIYYTYAPQGALSSISYTSPGAGYSTWYAVCDWRGDVVAFYDSFGNLQAKYIYDTWGNVIDIVDVNGVSLSPTSQPYNPGIVNPIRYRGYYHDRETGFFYLGSRYYDPDTGRFVNADDYGVILSSLNVLKGKNLFAYCNNNPVMSVDIDGEFPWVLIGAAVGGIINASVSIASQALSGEEINWGVVGVNFLSGAISGALSSVGMPIAASVGVNALLGGASYMGEQAFKGEEITPGGFLTSTAAGALDGVIGSIPINVKVKAEYQEIVRLTEKGARKELLPKKRWSEFKIVAGDAGITAAGSSSAATVNATSGGVQDSINGIFAWWSWFLWGEILYTGDFVKRRVC